MNVVFKLVIFSIILNLSTGIMIELIPAFDSNPGSRMGMTYKANYSNNFTRGPLNDTIAPGGVMESEGNLIYRVLDMMNIGFIYNFFITIDNYLYGFIVLLSKIFGGYIRNYSPSLYNIIFGGLRSLITMGYLLGAFKLWTGKDITD